MAKNNKKQESDVPEVDLSTVDPSIVEAVRKNVTPEIESHFQQKLAVERDNIQKQQAALVSQEVKKWIDAEAKKREPLSTDQIQQLLNKDYATFNVKLTHDGKSVDFELTELPQFYEKKFFKTAKRVLVSATSELSGAQFRLADGDVLEQISSLMDVVEPVFDIMAECVVICLNPKNEKEWLDVEWVQMNLCSERISTIVRAQAELNRMRDFFSFLFQGFQTSTGVIQAAVLQ